MLLSSDTNVSIVNCWLFISVPSVCSICSKVCGFYGQTAPEMDKPTNSCFLSILDGIGILSSGVMGALYVSAQKENSTAVATIETVSKLICTLMVLGRSLF